MATIKDISAREILDSRGYPTIEAKIVLSNNISAIASVPSGLLKSSYESKELRDNDLKRYEGFGVLRAIKKISEIIEQQSKLIEIESAYLEKLLNIKNGLMKDLLSGNKIVEINVDTYTKK